VKRFLVIAALAAVVGQPPPAWGAPKGRAARVQFRAFDSAAVKTKVSYHIYTPEVYDTEKERRFPVLSWLHGSGGGKLVAVDEGYELAEPTAQRAMMTTSVAWC